MLHRSCSLLMALVALVLCSVEASAQYRQLSLEVTPVHGTVSYGWASTPQRMVGMELGFGIPQVDRTLVPDDESLTNIFHLGVFARSRPADRLEINGRIQSGLAELHGCSGCFPGLLTAISGGVFYGGDMVKVGPRLTAGFLKEHGDPVSFVLNLTPVAVLFTYRW